MDKQTVVEELNREEAQSEDSDGKKSSSGCCQGKYHVIVAILVRCLLLIHATVIVWLLVSLKGDTLLWCFLVVNVLLMLEGVFSVVIRGGKENKWVCPAFLAYLAAVLPPIWLVELDRLHRYNDALSSSNLTSLADVIGLTVPVKLAPEVWVSVMEQTLLFMLVVCRWLLPRGDISRHELSQLLFVFMGIASDNLELFELFDEPAIRTDKTLTYVILGVWSLSLLQFIFVLTSTKNPQKSEVVHDPPNEKGKRKKRGNMCEVVVTTEIWSLLFSVLVQDGPFAATRIYALARYTLINYSIIFFICKNILIVCLVIYRFIILCFHKFRDDDTDDKDDKDDDAASESSLKTGGNKSLLFNTRNIRVKPMQMTTLGSDTKP